MEGDDGRDRLEGRFGRVTVAIPPDGRGEVMIETRDGPERYAAWSRDPVPRHAPVEVVKVREDGGLEVTAFGSSPA